jgi:uncharacterized protein (DUF433 family)
MTPNEIVAALPDLEAEDVHESLRYGASTSSNVPPIMEP